MPSTEPMPNKTFGFHALILHKNEPNIQNLFIRRKLVSITIFVHSQSAIFQVCTAYLVQEARTKNKKSR